MEATTQPQNQPARFRNDDDLINYVPVHVVWEITLACNQKCQHCGSRAGKARSDELSTAECLSVVEQLAEMGTREITLIGGEAYLRKDWLEIVRAIRSHGIYCAIQTGGWNLDAKRLSDAAAAGLQGIGVSIDGLEAVHDRTRGVPGSYANAFETLRLARELGLRISANTVIGPESMRVLPELMDRLIAAGVTHWQLQLAVAMGNAVDNPEQLLQPYQLAELMPLIARLYHKGVDNNLLIIAGNNIGYFGPYEHLFRTYEDTPTHWTGCGAGQTAIGLEANGSIKGCPSLATDGYSGGNVRNAPLRELWHESKELYFNRLRSAEQLWGFCSSCYYAALCRGGCTWTSDSLFGRPGNNPYCYYRVSQLAKEGLRERVEKIADAAKTPFAIGAFKLVLENHDGERLEETFGVGANQQARFGFLEKIPDAARRARQGAVPERLVLCRNCDCFVYADETDCVHCGADVKAANARYGEDSARRQALMDKLAVLLGETAAA
ncbi:GDL motif peptide-associated radical SAM/SPASM maturase [Methylogaea oryzae]|uniref:GDL motif peptide-associated radical SAM/SPASM maturase n=1 Tax=Methylogaea oryzae TaxID=1295382 RepID=A0A8D4VMR6_9GAMM|nr:GDL motif peptide-associated radical SAM/SPASM maturase [Methylogaea oryzae]BBL71048.1 GDL motif peptide-associated radical SAM/SPASM maturase [Methylogaea oryzae]